MTRRTPRTFKMAAAVCLALVCASPTWAKGLDDFKLTRAIPADAYFAAHSRSHSGQEWLEQQFAKVWEEVEKARFDRDLKKILKSMQPPSATSQPDGAPDPFETQWQKLSDLFNSVNWGNLGKRESAVAMKLTFPTVDMVCLMVPPEGEVDEMFKGLSGIVTELVSLTQGGLQLTTDDSSGATVHKVTFPGAPFPFAITVARHKDVILFGFGASMAEQSLALLSGEKGETLASTERFKKAFAELPAATDSAAYVDIARLMTQIRALLGSAMEMARNQGGGEQADPDIAKVEKAMNAFIDLIDMFEYSASVATTEGMKTTTRSRTVLRDDAEKHGAYPVFFGGEPIKDPLKYVPADAGSFSVSGCFDVYAAYKVLIKFLRENVPDVNVDEHLAAAKAQTGMDVEEDMVSWIGQRFLSVSIPGPTPYSPGESIFMMDVRDAAKAQKMLDHIEQVITPMLAGQMQGSITPAEIEGVEGFKSVNIQMLAMMGLNKPTFGIKDDKFIFGSSPEVIQKILEVGAGKADNFSKSERFKAEGLEPKGAVMSLSFSDLSRMGEELGQLLSMMPMIQMAIPDIGRNPGAQAAFSIIGKMGRIVRKLDFFQSSASRSVMDGKVIVTDTLMTYREPPKPKAPEKTTEGATESQ